VVARPGGPAPAQPGVDESRSRVVGVRARRIRERALLRSGALVRAGSALLRCLFLHVVHAYFIDLIR